MMLCLTFTRVFITGLCKFYELKNNLKVDLHRYFTNIQIDNTPTQKIQECKSLRVTTDQHLSWNSNTGKKIRVEISALRHLQKLGDKQAILSVYNALIYPYFEYCCEICDVFGETP